MKQEVFFSYSFALVSEVATLFECVSAEYSVSGCLLEQHFFEG